MEEVLMMPSDQFSPVYFFLTEAAIKGVNLKIVNLELTPKAHERMKEDPFMKKASNKDPLRETWVIEKNTLNGVHYPSLECELYFQKRKENYLVTRIKYNGILCRLPKKKTNVTYIIDYTG